MAGVLGDSGLKESLPFFFAEGPSLERLLSADGGHRGAMASRQMARAVLRTTVGDTQFCMGANIGLDNRRLLPPFQTAARNEDGIFSGLVRRCLPGSFIGFLPRTVLHAPVDPRQFPVDRFDAFLDPRTFCSLHISKYAEAGSRKRQTEIGFDYARGKAALDEKNLQTGELKHVENDIPSCVTDVISAFYYVASLPLQPGNTFTFPVNDGGKTSEIIARVEALEQVKVPAGTFQTMRVEAQPISGLLKGKAAVWVWFDSDAEHAPVQIRSKLKWGTLLFKLQRR